MAYWLLKSEPYKFSWDDQVEKGEGDPDPEKNETGKFVTVDVKPVKPLETSVTLADLKAHPMLSNMKVVKQVRLSVCPVTEEEWKEVCAIGGV